MFLVLRQLPGAEEEAVESDGSGGQVRVGMWKSASLSPSWCSRPERLRAADVARRIISHRDMLLGGEHTAVAWSLGPLENKGRGGHLQSPFATRANETRKNASASNNFFCHVECLMEGPNLSINSIVEGTVVPP